MAEEEIVAANARVGVAMANFLPRIGLTAVYGGSSSELKDLVSGSASLWNVVGEMAGPLFQGGLRLSEYRSQKSAWEEAQARCEETVLNALAEVSDALTAQQKLAEELVQREREVAALTESVELSILRYRQGLSSYYEVLDAQERLYPAQRQLVGVQRDWLTAVVGLYRRCVRPRGPVCGSSSPSRAGDRQGRSIPPRIRAPPCEEHRREKLRSRQVR